MTRREELERLRDDLIGGGVDCAAVLKLFSRVALHFLSACNGDMNAAMTFVSAVLPGWGWRVAQCSVSDDAWVFPDFNCPVHGPRLLAELDESRDWTGDTDVDQRPPGNPARALLLACLSALIAQEGQE